MSDPLPPLEDIPPTGRRLPSPWTVAMVVLLITLGSFGLIGPLVGIVVAYVIYGNFDMDFMQFVLLLGDPIGQESLRTTLLIVQAFATVVGLAVIPPLFWKTMTRRPIVSLFQGPPVKLIYYVMSVGIVIFFAGPNSVFIDWNAHIDLPDGALENWAKDLETRAAELTEYMVSFSSVGQYLLGVLVIAILPAIGEEIVFRGLLQPELQKGTGNAHVGIWLSAIFFSALHLQFYGFFPRVFLGALFGYLYYWSGNNLGVPMFAHFVNNFFQVTAIYLGVIDLPGVEGEDPAPMPWYGVAIFTVLCGALLYWFRAMYSNRVTPDDVRT